MASHIATVALHKVVRKAKHKTLKTRAAERKELDQAVSEWKNKWRSAQGRNVQTDWKYHVLTINVSPSGLQWCLNRVCSLFAHFHELPAIIHVQDIKITVLCTKTIQPQLQRLCPDYTSYIAVHPARRKRHYNLGVMTLVRNDIAFTCKAIDFGAFLDQARASLPIDKLEEHCAGRVLCLQTRPAGPKGPVWHVNVYQHTASACAEHRKAVWEVVCNILEQALEQGAAVVLAGDCNATMHYEQHMPARLLSRPDKTFCKLVAMHHGAAAIGVPGEYSWGNPRGTCQADLDHIIVLPSILAHSGRRMLSKLDPGLDHWTMAVTLDSAVLGEAAVIKKDPGFHVPHFKTIDYHMQLPFLQDAVWTAGCMLPTDKVVDWADDEQAMLETLIQRSETAFGNISGYTEAPKVLRGRMLPGHKAAH